MSVPLNLAEAALRHLTTWLVYSFFGIALCANLGVVLLLWSPLRKSSAP
jgi:hypothetical protein